jgi:drug/metabolite transporter (DMT)-like permease
MNIILQPNFMLMFLPASFLGVFFALTSAGVWGGADFSGGFATRRSNQFQVLALAALSGILVLAVCAVVWRESFPGRQSLVLAGLGGLAGALGLAALYRALSMGYVASVAPTAAVIGAALPVLFGIVVDGFPSVGRLAGFALAFLGIWLVSRPSDSQAGVSRQGLLLACLAGIGFGGFFILLGEVEPGKVFTPLILARCVEFIIAVLLIRLNRLSFPSLRTNPYGLLAGALDAGGNVFYLLARQYIRLDAAAVLSSMYPITTILLAGLVLKEKVSRSQGMGVLVCLLSIVLIMI